MAEVEKATTSEDDEQLEAAPFMPLAREFTFWVFIKSSNRAADDWKPKQIASF